MDDFCGLVFKSAVMQNLWRKIEIVAKTDLPVLICGETGTGKELVAKAIHYLSRKQRGQFIPVNCGGIPESLIEKELFGSNRGAFTGASDSQVGAFEAANNGSIFLDEISEASMQFQVNLLRVLETKEIKRVGSAHFQKIDARVIIATNKNLDELVEKRKFRKDLLYRLKVLPLNVPPLREREEDALRLIEYFFNEGDCGRNMLNIPDETKKMALRYHWPGNVRELKNSVIKAAVFADGDMQRFNEALHSDLLIKPVDYNVPKIADETIKPLQAVLQRQKIDLIKKTIAECGGNKSKAARMLGMSRKNLLGWAKR